MAGINLLPWREGLRREQHRLFQLAMAATVVASIFLVILAGIAVSANVAGQRDRNQYLQTEIDILDRQINEVNGIKQKKDQLLARMEVIQSLQGNRPVIVRIFDELVRVVPEGIYFTSLSMSGNQISIQGLSESNDRISNLMRQLDESKWFKEPNLTAVKAIKELEKSEFDLTVTLAPDQETGQEGGEA